MSYEQHLSRVVRFSTCVLSASIFALSLIASHAEAQGNSTSSGLDGSGWLEGRNRAEGPGFRVGNLELHPGFGVEFGYDTNVFLEDVAPQGAPILRLTGHLLVSTLGQQRIEESDKLEKRKISFRGGLSGSFYHYFDTQAKDNVEGAASLNLTINPDGNFRVRLYNEYARSIRPFVRSGTITDVLTYGRNQNTAGVELNAHSRGSVISGSLGYEFGLDLFEDELLTWANNFQHKVRGTMNWRFLPSTALVHETEVIYQDYRNEEIRAGVAAREDNWRLLSRVGINGALSRTISFTAMVGYTAMFIPNELTLNDEFQSIDVQADLRWTPAPNTRFGIGYRRRFLPAFVGQFRKTDVISARFQTIGFGALLLGLEATLSFDKTGSALASVGGDIGSENIRSDIRLRARLFAEYRFTDYLGLNANLAFLGDFTSFEFTSGTIDPGEFNKFEAFLGLRVFY